MSDRFSGEMSVARRRVARATRPGGPEVIEVAVEDVPALKDDEVLVRVEAVGLNHAETLIRSGTYVVKMPFPFPLGGEGSGTILDVGPGVTLQPGARVCWAAILGSCADRLVAPAAMMVSLPDSLSFESGACLPVAGLTAGGLARVWPLARGSTSVVWAAAGAVGRMLVALLADRGVNVIGIASGLRGKGVRDAGATRVIDRTVEDVQEAVRVQTDGRLCAAVFDPIGAATYQTSLRLLAPRGCLISYGELSGPLPAIDSRDLFPGSVFVTRFNGTRWLEGPEDLVGLVSDGLVLAAERPTVISEVAGRFPLDHVVDAYRALEKAPKGKVLVIPDPSSRLRAGEWSSS
ncbi:MAG TPA: zinc-binding dehydrogenase [Thermoanaerobaculia bacterium]|nr:zinc-binding dehydrogenase [Thermoanaerobaculia bacterium]